MVAMERINRLLAAFTILPTAILSFSSTKSFIGTSRVVPQIVHHHEVFKSALFQSIDQNDGVVNENIDDKILSKAKEHFKSNLLYTFTLPEHKPLGCTAEESLVQSNDGSKFVFISKLIPGGFAANAGLEVGDLIVGVSGTFDVLEDVFGEGLDRIRPLIAGRLEEDELTIKVIRNTDVQQKHESALVDLCILPEGQLSGRDATIEKCIETMYKASYEIDDVEGVDNGCEDEDMECMLDTITDLWSEDYGIDGGKSEQKKLDEDEKKDKNKPPPWSSRSSPSGTFVRVNGTMVNIDE